MDVKDGVLAVPMSGDTAVQSAERSMPVVHIKSKPVYSFVKRSFDFVCSFVGLAILLVAFLFIALIAKNEILCYKYIGDIYGKYKYSRN